jgi:hypothetical protein
MKNISHYLTRAKELGLKGTLLSLNSRISSKYSSRNKILCSTKQIERLTKSLAEMKSRMDNLSTLRYKTLSYVESMRIKEKPLGYYFYSASQRIPVLYASLYAALIRHLYGDIQTLNSDEKTQWIEYINSFQSEDGLYRDPKVSNTNAEVCVWWGWQHMTLHVLMALTALGGIVQRPFTFLERFYDTDVLVQWLKNRDWANNACNVSNEVQNIGTFLQYSRDFHEDEKAGKAVDYLLDWLETIQDPQTGSWEYPIDTPMNRSLNVQTGYHLWLLFFYDKRPLKYINNIIDTVLSTQNSLGGFGVPLNSSACEDIDSIDPLVRLSQFSDYRREDIKEVLSKSLPWVLVNMNEDGGFVFRRIAPFEYGHKYMSSLADESAMFPTWFRTLSLAYLSKALPDTFIDECNWNFLNCPGHQF